MTPNQKILAAILIIAAIFGAFAWHEGWITIPTGEEITLAPPTTGEQWAGGTFTLTVSGRNTLDSSASLTTGTNFDSSWYGYRSGQWVFLGSGSGSGSNIESIAEDAGYIWLLTEEKSAQYYYADTAFTLSKNTYMVDYKWIDADEDTEKEFLYKCSLWDIPPPASGYPARTYYPYYLAESNDGSYATSECLQWETQPSDQTGIGESTVTKYIGWESKLAASQQAIGIHKIEIIVNSTTTTLWEIDKVNIPGVGYIDGSLFTEDVRSSDTKYQYIIGTDFDNIVYWKVPAGQNNKFDNTVAVKCSYTTNTELQYTLYIYQWTSQRISVSDNDPVSINEA